MASLRQLIRNTPTQGIHYSDGKRVSQLQPTTNYERPAENDHRLESENRTKVVIGGAGEVGSSIAGSLSGDHDVTVGAIDPGRVDALTFDLDVLSVFGDGTDAETLRDAGVPGAALFIANTDSDETNLVACGTANALGSPFTTARGCHSESACRPRCRVY